MGRRRESPTLKGIILEGTADLAGACVGEIKPKERITLGDKLLPSDAILLVESNGVHANGLTLARTIASQLPEGYRTNLSDGSLYGETLLAPTHIYVPLIRGLFEAGIDIHYLVNVTGHGWRKLMRANRELSYIIDCIPEPQPIFHFIQEHSKNDGREMYGNFNMGAGFAVYLPEKDVPTAQTIAKSLELKTWLAGYVDHGPRRVVIRPKNIIFQGETLGVR